MRCVARSSNLFHRRACAPPLYEQAAGHVLGDQRVANVVAPGSVDVELATSNAFFPEPELLNHSTAGMVLGADVRLDPVQPGGEEAVVDGHGEGGGGDAAAGEGAVDPVADLGGAGRAPDDGADGELSGEAAVVRDHPGHGEPLPGLTAQGGDHGEVRAEAGTEERRLGVARFPGAQPVGVAHPGVAPDAYVAQPEWPEGHRAL